MVGRLEVAPRQARNAAYNFRLDGDLVRMLYPCFILYEPLHA
jgi:hypothetical protein